MLTAQNETDYFASSEGSRVVTPHCQARLVVFAVTRADDGMDLFREQTFEAETVDGLPAQPSLKPPSASSAAALKRCAKPRSPSPLTARHSLRPRRRRLLS